MVPELGSAVRGVAADIAAGVAGPEKGPILEAPMAWASGILVPIFWIWAAQIVGTLPWVVLGPVLGLVLGLSLVEPLAGMLDQELELASDEPLARVALEGLLVGPPAGSVGGSHLSRMLLMIVSPSSSPNRMRFSHSAGVQYISRVCRN